MMPQEQDECIARIGRVLLDLGLIAKRREALAPGAARDKADHYK
jgi:hypothetical protein